MAIYNTFSKRNNPKKCDVFEYENFSSKFRGQVTYILENTLTQDDNSWKEIYKSICEEFGKNYLSHPYNNMYNEEIIEYIIKDITSHILETKNTIELLDTIDLSF